MLHTGQARFARDELTGEWEWTEEPVLDEEAYAAIGKVALAAGAVDECRFELEKITDVQTKGWTDPKLRAWWDTARVLREDRNRLLHAGIDFEVDFEIEDGMAEPFAFPVLIDGGRGRSGPGSQTISVSTWEELAEQLWSSAAQGEVLIYEFRSLTFIRPPGLTITHRNRSTDALGLLSLSSG